MDIIKIIGVGLISLIIIIILKQYKPDFAIYISILAGAIIILLVMDKLSSIVSLLTSIQNRSNTNNQFLVILLKITGIAFLTEYASSICNDAGESAISAKIDLGGKVLIVALSIPIIQALLELIIRIMP